MSSEPNEHINKGEKIEFDCGTVVTLTHMSPQMAQPVDKDFLAGVTVNSEHSGGIRTHNGTWTSEVQLLFYIRNIPSIIHMLQRIYKTGMGTH
jgi:hypothetical protein